MRARSTLTLALVLLTLLAPAAAAHHPGSVTGLAKYQTLPGEDRVVHDLLRVDEKFAAWEEQWPERVERLTIGETSSGFPLLAVRVTDERVAFEEAPLSTGSKLRVYLDGGHHGNEYLGVELVMYYLEDLLARAEAGDEAIQAFLQETEVYALPIVNVDGNFADTRKNSNQVDPNRNYDFHWGQAGASDFIGAFTYHGPEPFSEKETRANADFALEISPDLWITMHTGIAEFYWPWGWTHDPSPDDAFFTSLEAPFEAATNGRVDAMQAAELYLAAGATDDWGYGVAGTATFTYEVHEDQFVPVYGDPIPEVISDQLAGLEFMVRNVSRMGAWVELVREDEGAFLENRGWAVAENVTVTSGEQTAVVPEIAPGARVPLPVPATDDVEVTYKVLRIDVSRTRTHTWGADGLATADGATASVPGVAPALASLALVGAALAVRRRERQL